MILLHDTYHLRPGALDEFEDAYWEHVVPAATKAEGVKPLWLLRQRTTAEGEVAVGLTAVRSGADLGDYTASDDGGAVLEGLSLGHARKALLAAPWSPLSNWDEVATIGSGAAAPDRPRVFMEDTGWPYAPVSDYVDFQRREYWEPLQQWAATGGGLLKLWGFFLVASGTGRRPEAVFLQEVLDLRALQQLVSEPEEYDPDTFPGSYMVHGLEYRDQWRSRLLVLSQPRSATHA
ncbi:MAG: hypothetical protein J2P57_04340 [Acidimicrobiaceae bacterium]|nr:hypothetical protein [Acidimicrobiaceae bacterium]